MDASKLTSTATASVTGILTLQPTSQVKTKAAGLTRHQLAMIALGVPAIGFGTFAVFWRKYLHENSHFTTWHGVSQRPESDRRRHTSPS